MTLTVVVGSSGSGKTTFLNDATKQHGCTYIRQYHNIRPYVRVTAIPNFDPTQLPYWDTYVKEGTAAKIKVGGTMAGEFTAGLSGGQRKLLLFEIIYQRTMPQSDLLLVFDEPFAGVTDDFVPFITQRLEALRQRHNIVLVTNDHVDTLKGMADNTITVSAIDRSTVSVNGLTKVDRAKAILALSVGDEYEFASSSADLRFFYNVEIANSGALFGVAAFTVFAFSMFLLTFWNSQDESGALVIVAASIIAFFCLNPYLLALVDWRNYMTEESEALLHSSKEMNKILKSGLTITLIFVVAWIEYGIVNAVMDTDIFASPKYWYAMLCDSVSMTFPFIVFGLYTNLSFAAVEIFASMPFLFMIFFSTTFSPGSGVELIKEFRYLFARFYWWCMLPDVQDSMDGCPATETANILYMTLSALLGVILFSLWQLAKYLRSQASAKKKSAQLENLKDAEFVDLQIELYGSEVLQKDSLAGSVHSRTRSQTDGSAASSSLPGKVDESDDDFGVVKIGFVKGYNMELSEEVA